MKFNLISIVRERAGTLASMLLTETLRVSHETGHNVIDPAHLLLAIMGNPSDYQVAYNPLHHPMHRGVFDHQRGLGLTYQDVRRTLSGFGEQLFDEELDDFAIEYNDASHEMFRLADTFAAEDMRRRDQPDKHITVFNLAWAAVLSGSKVVDSLIPDKFRAKQEFFRLYDHDNPNVPSDTRSMVLPTFE